MKKKNKPILVTGSHRSGSTWVGKMLSLNFNVKYISEPFNPGYGLRVFDSWFVYINENNQHQYKRDIEKLLKFRGGYRFNLPALRYWANWLIPISKTALIKDPIACFSSDWLAKNFDMDVVVVFRHPAAFYLSLKRMNWRFDFSNFTSQSDLMNDHLNSYRDLIEKSKKDFVTEASVLWLCIHSVLHTYVEQNSNWLVKKHEDLSTNPVEEFKDLYNKLGLKFNKRIENKIIESTSGSNKNLNKALELKRDSKKIVDTWKDKLTKDELEVIKSITYPISKIYYPEF